MLAVYGGGVVVEPHQAVIVTADLRHVHYSLVRGNVSVMIAYQFLCHKYPVCLVFANWVQV